MNDTVMKLLSLADEYAEHYAEDRRWGTFTADTTKARQALQDELVRLFTPSTREQVKGIMSGSGYDTATAQERADFINGIRHGEIYHGITGEKNEVA